MGVLRQMHPLPRRAEQMLRILNQFTEGRAPCITSNPRRTRPHDSRLLVVRARPDRPQSGAHHAAPLPPRIRRPSHGSSLAAGVCQELALSPCENSCPLHMNIPRFLELYKEGRLEDAFESVILDNPLPASTGRVCQHPCDNRCRRHSLDESVNMREVHRLIADSIFLSDRFDEMVRSCRGAKMTAHGKKIAVVALARRV